MSDWERLRSIVESGRLIGHEMPGTKARAVCFTEATSAGCAWLVGQGRYTSCGLAFTKRFLLEDGDAVTGRRTTATVDPACHRDTV